VCVRGAGGGWGRVQILRIMKDSRCGAAQQHAAWMRPARLSMLCGRRGARVHSASLTVTCAARLCSCRLQDWHLRPRGHGAVPAHEAPRAGSAACVVRGRRAGGGALRQQVVQHAAHVLLHLHTGAPPRLLLLLLMVRTGLVASQTRAAATDSSSDGSLAVRASCPLSVRPPDPARYAHPPRCV
jgi:hypothetical protein